MQRSSIIQPSIVENRQTPRNRQSNPQQRTSIKNQQQSYQIPLIGRLVVALCFIIGYTFYRLFYVKFDNSSCIQDTYFAATFTVNRWMNDGAANYVLGLGQVMIDAWIIFLGIGWLILVKNMRFPLSAGVIFLFRTFFLTITKMPFDDYIVWHSPGFLTFTVPYDRTRDFFFSGHTSTLLIITVQCFILGWYWVGAFAFLNLLFMMNMLIISRIHYTIDICGALIFTAVTCRLVWHIIKYMDYVFSIPFYVGRFSYNKIKNRMHRNDQEEQMLNFRPETQQAIRQKHLPSS